MLAAKAVRRRLYRPIPTKLWKACVTYGYKGRLFVRDRKGKVEEAMGAGLYTSDWASGP